MLELEKIISEATQTQKSKIAYFIWGSSLQIINGSSYLGITVETGKGKRDHCWGPGATEREISGYKWSDWEKRKNLRFIREGGEKKEQGEKNKNSKEAWQIHKKLYY